MDFKTFLKEEEKVCLIDSINQELAELDDEELDILGSVIYSEFFEEDFDQEPFSYTLEDVQEMIFDLGKEMYIYILNLIENSDILGDDDMDEMDDEMDEATSRKLKAKNKNKKKRLFMTKSKAELRKTAQSRKKSNRVNRAKNRKYRRVNVKKIASYQKSRASAIKKGTHIVKIRRQS